jgi:hypothetical protein
MSQQQPGQSMADPNAEVLRQLQQSMMLERSMNQVSILFSLHQSIN